MNRTKKPAKLIPVILCGGAGTRLWPLSSREKPKQFLKLLDGRSLLQNTAARAMRIGRVEARDILTVTLAALKTEIGAEYAALNPGLCRRILYEPDAKNTAAAIAAAAFYIRRAFGPETLLWVLPSDHHIGDERALETAVEQACLSAGSGRLTAFGIRPSSPETQYGYIKAGTPLEGQDAAFHILEFAEKPDLQTALHYIQSGEYDWNSGMYVMTAGAALESIKTLQPHLYDALEPHIDGADETPEITIDPAAYDGLPPISFDKAVMEKTQNAAVVRTNPAWSDIGSWQALHRIGPRDEHGNVAPGRAILENCRNVIIHGNGRLIACAGLDNIVVAETPDGILVADHTDGASLSAVVKKLTS